MMDKSPINLNRSLSRKSSKSPISSKADEIKSKIHDLKSKSKKDLERTFKPNNDLDVSDCKLKKHPRDNSIEKSDYRTHSNNSRVSTLHNQDKSFVRNNTTLFSTKVNNIVDKRKLKVKESSNKDLKDKSLKAKESMSNINKPGKYNLNKSNNQSNIDLTNTCSNLDMSKSPKL